jgi:mannose-1-phosphate guanylyltransferase
MLQIWLELCRQHGIDEVLINIHSHAEKVRQFLRHCKEGPQVRVVEEKELLGSAGTLLANREWLGSDPVFFVFYADVLHRVDLTRMLELHEATNPAATLAVYRVPDPRRCGIVEIAEDATIIDFVEKPTSPRSDLAFSGLLIGTPLLLNAIPRKRPADIGFDVLPRLVGRMRAHTVSEYLIDIGTPENYQKAQTTWPGPAVISQSREKATEVSHFFANRRP